MIDSFRRPAPGTYGYAGAIVVAQMMAQVGGFALPALLPTYMRAGTSRRPKQVGSSASSSPRMS